MDFRRWRFIVGFLMLAISFTDISQGKGGFIDIDSKLKALRKPAVKSIKSSDGDIIDCVNIHNQPAFDHPALKNHTIQMRPSFLLKQNVINDQNKSSSIKTLQQIWHKSGSCPEGTIPIRRVRKRDLLRFENLERFGRKAPTPMAANNSSENKQLYPDRTLVFPSVNVTLSPRPNHSSAVLLATIVHYLGARGTINIWNPRVARWDEYTTAQIWLMSGGMSDYESVEAGWIVNQKLYGDTRTRFLTYWTRDGSHNTGCFDMICNGFMQTSSEVVLGGALSSVSTLGGMQYVFTVEITQDPRDGNWWLSVMSVTDKITIGYWPSALFSQRLRQGAIILQWGGEVYSTDIRKTPHTTTVMGSGEFGVQRGYTSYIEHIRVLLNPDDPWVYPRPQYIATYADERNCYAVNHYVQSFMAEPTLFFGGPGQSPICP